MAYGLWANKGRALAKMNKYEEALASFNKALEYSPDKYEIKEEKKKVQKKLDTTRAK